MCVECYYRKVVSVRKIPSVIIKKIHKIQKFVMVFSAEAVYYTLALPAPNLDKEVHNTQGCGSYIVL